MLKISCFILLSAVLLTSLIALSACRQGDEVFEPELPPSPCAVHELVGAAFINQAATLARDEMLKTYTLTYSPAADSTITALVCDTTAYDLSALIGQVRFSGRLRAAGQEAPQPAAGQAYYSLELKGAPILDEAICTARALIAEVIGQTAMLARDESLKTYTLTYSPVADSTVIGIVCDTTAHHLSALAGQVRFSGRLRAAGQDVPQPAAGQAYYSLELKNEPKRQETEEETPPTKPDKEPEDSTPPKMPEEDLTQDLQRLIPFGEWRRSRSQADRKEGDVWSFSKNQLQVNINPSTNNTSQNLIQVNGVYPINIKKPNEIVIGNVTYQFYIELFLDGGVSVDGDGITFKRANNPFEGLPQSQQEEANRQHTPLFFVKWDLTKYMRPWSTFRTFNEGDVIWIFLKNKVNVIINLAVSDQLMLPLKPSGEYPIAINKHYLSVGGQAYTSYMKLVLKEKDSSAPDKQLTLVTTQRSNLLSC